jgi:hypothetical protein
MQKLQTYLSLMVHRFDFINIPGAYAGLDRSGVSMHWLLTVCNE